MSDTGPSLIFRLFCDVQQVPINERDAWLTRRCEGNEALRSEVLRLLSDHEPSRGQPPTSNGEVPSGGWNAPTLVPSTAAAAIGMVIGPYTIRQKLGEGGFGVVYLAEQNHPVRRKVALKIIKPGMDTQECIARFEAERQALALMDHPNIANVLEAGTTASGHPYFVMELVRGVPITEFCDEHRMPLRERLSLFVSVCRAVQHAHQKGIIHRDLKPSNVLVVEHEGVPVVKVIDFGIAKALGQQLTEHTVFTTFGQMVGTPLYMSPEQADANVVDVDTRSDIYSLGVLLYELMTGRTPIDKQRMRRAALDEVRRIIREEDPPSLSRRLSSLEAQELSSISQLRGLTPHKLVSQFQGELDWVAMKALEKDRTRRYDSASGFAADIERYLTDLPVHARPASTGYRFRKFVVRHKAGTAAAVLVGVSVLAALAGLAVSNRLIRQERDAKDQALTERDTALRVSRQHEQQAQASAVEADASRREALANAAIAEQERDDKTRQLYLAHMNIAFQEWNNNNADRTRDLVSLYLPGNRDEADHRDWEWHYLWRLSHSELRRINTVPTGVSDAEPDSTLSLAISPDDRWLAAGGGSGTLRVKSFDGTEEIRSIRAHSGRLQRLSISADGKWIATAGSEGTVKLWSTADWAEVRSIPGPHNIHYGMAVSPAGDRIAVALNEITIYGIPDGEEVARLPGHTGRVRGLQFSADGSLLASGAEDGTSCLWNLATGELIHRVTMGASVALSPDGRTLVTGDGTGHVGFWDCNSGQQLAVHKQHSGEVSRIAFSHDGSKVVTAGADTAAYVWDVTNRRPLHSFLGHGALITDVAFSHDDEIVVSCGWDRSIRQWDIASRNELLQSAPEGVDGAVFSPDGSRIAAGRWTQLMVFDAASRRQIWAIAEDSPRPYASLPLQFDAGAQWLITGRGDGTVVVRDASTGALVKKFQAHNREITALQVLRNGQIVTGDGAGEIGIWGAINAGSPELGRAAMIEGPVGSLAVSPDETLLAVGGDHFDLVVQLWSLKENRLVKSLKGHQGYSYSLYFSHDGHRLNCGARDGHLTAWELSTGRIVRRHRAHLGSVTQAVVSPNGQRVATSDGSTVKVWDDKTGMEVITLKPQLGEVTSVSFSPDGSCLMVGGKSGGFVIYDSRALTPELRGGPWVASVRHQLRLETLRNRVVQCQTDGRLLEAIAALQEMGTLPGQSADYVALRELYARTQQWPAALEANQHVQQDGINWQHVALLYELGQHDEYRQARERLLAESGRVSQHWEIHFYLVAALLLPIDPDQEPAIRRLANALSDSDLPWERAMVGRAMYRLDEFESWHTGLDDDSPLKSGHELLLAITAFRAHPTAVKRETVEQAIQHQKAYAQSRMENGNLEVYWHNYVDALAWAREAERVVNETPQ